MSENGKRYVFSGHAIGVAAQFHRLGEMTGLNHVVPTLAAAVLPVTGGLSHSHVTRFDFPVEQPWKRSLLSVSHVASRAEGTEFDDGYRTEVQSRIENLLVVEKLHIGLVELHMSATRTGTEPPVIRTDGNRIEGMRLGNVQVAVTLANETLCHCASKQQLSDFHSLQEGASPLHEYNGYYRCTLVRDIQLSGPPDEVAKIQVSGNRLVWPGFGKIFLAELLVGDSHRRLTLVRLEMGSDAGGSGSIGDAGTNGHVST